MKLIPITNVNSWKPAPKAKKTSPYKMQREVMNEFMKPLRLFLRGICLNPRGSEHYKLVLKENLQRAFKCVYVREIDYSRILVSKGKLPLPRNISVKSRVPGALLFSWNDNSGRRGAYWTDYLFVALYHHHSGKWVFEMNEAIRSDCEFDMDVYGLEGQTVHIYAGFFSRDCDRVSKSVFLGKVKIISMVSGLRA